MEGSNSTWKRAAASPLGGSALVALAALLILLLHAPTFRLDRLHSGPSDQANFISTSRWLADHGELRSHLVYPAFLDVPGWRLYMPGHYWALAAVDRAFGAGPLRWRILGFASFVAAAVAVFLTGRRLRGPPVGFVAALLFALFPANVAYSFTAMSEPPTTAAAAIALAVFVHLPDRARLPLAPLLLALPFLFRETTALLAIPLAALALRAPRTGFLRPALCAAATLGLLGSLYAWQTAAGKQSLPLSWIATGEGNYDDLLVEEEVAALSPIELAGAFGANVRDNLALLSTPLLSSPAENPGLAFTLAALLLAAIPLAVGLLRRPRDPFVAAAGLLTFAVFALILTLHKLYEHVAIRHLLFATPVTAIALAACVPRLARAREAPGSSGGGRAAAVALLLALALFHVWGVRAIAPRLCPDQAPLYTVWLEEIGHDEDTLLVAPAKICADYMLKHYPVRAAFIPANDETLIRLAERFEIGTLVLRGTYLDKTIRRETIASLGLQPHPVHFTKIPRFLVFTRG